MELSYAIARYEQALELLPVRWQQAARRLPAAYDGADV